MGRFPFCRCCLMQPLRLMQKRGDTAALLVRRRIMAGSILCRCCLMQPPMSTLMADYSVVHEPQLRLAPSYRQRSA
jgi:hypothetical protein